MSQRLTVIDSHELGRDQPYPETALLKPVVRQQHEVTVQPCEAVNLPSQSAYRQSLQSGLLGAIEVVVPDVGGICENQVIAPTFVRRRKTSEVRREYFKPCVCPKLGRGVRERLV